MKIQNKIILSLSAVALLSTSAFAGKHESMKNQCEYKMQQHKMVKQSKHHKRGNPIFKSIMSLDLSPTQTEQIKTIINDSKKSVSNPSDAFTATNFDKNKFIQTLEQRHAQRNTKQAEVIEKMYNVLNTVQKKNLKTLLDMHEIKKAKMMKNHSKGSKNHDRSCNTK